jgi:hypothetical protein
MMEDTLNRAGAVMELARTLERELAEAIKVVPNYEAAKLGFQRIAELESANAALRETLRAIYNTALKPPHNMEAAALEHIVKLSAVHARGPCPKCTTYAECEIECRLEKQGQREGDTPK